MVNYLWKSGENSPTKTKGKPMSEAWIKRGGERQSLHEKTHHDIYLIEERSEEWSDHRHQACAYLAQVIISYLFGGKISHLSGSTREQYEKEADEFFQNIILPRYDTFSRAEEEKRALLAELATWLIRASLARFSQQLLSKEIADPKVIFKTPTAVTKVE